MGKEAGGSGRQRCMEEGIDQDWWEEVKSKSSLGRYLTEAVDKHSYYGG